MRLKADLRAKIISCLLRSCISTKHIRHDVHSKAEFVKTHLSTSNIGRRC